MWAVLLLGLWLGIPTPGPNTFRPQLNVEYNAMVPERPARADDMHIAVGRFDGYGLVGGPPVFAEFSLRDLKTNAVTKYLIAQNTTIDGIPLKCETSKASAAGA